MTPPNIRMDDTKKQTYN